MSRPHPVRTPVAAGRPVLLALLAALLVPLEAAGQFLPTPGPERRQAAPERGIETALVGRIGVDVQFRNAVLGGLARATFPLPLSPTVQASGDLTFFQGFTDRGGGFDLLLELIPGIHLGGGPYWRNTVFPGDSLGDFGRTDRETRLGWSAVAQLGGIGGFGRTVNGISFRWAEVDGYNPQILTLQVGIRLTGGGRAR